MQMLAWGTTAVDTVSWMSANVWMYLLFMSFPVSYSSLYVIVFNSRGSSDKVGWSTHVEGEGPGSPLSPFMGLGMSQLQIFWKYGCISMQLGAFRGEIRRMCNLMFNVDFERAIWWYQVIRSGAENRCFYRPCCIGSTTHDCLFSFFSSFGWVMCRDCDSAFWCLCPVNLLLLWIPLLFTSDAFLSVVSLFCLFLP